MAKSKILSSTVGRSYGKALLMLSVGVMLLLISTALFFRAVSPGHLADKVEVASDKYSLVLDNMQTQLNDTSALIELAGQGMCDPALNALGMQPWELLLYENDSLVLWSDNRVLLSPARAAIIEKPIILELQNGLYAVLPAKSSNVNALALLPVRTSYAISNSYLESHWLDKLGLPAAIIPSADNTEAEYYLKSSIPGLDVGMVVDHSLPLKASWIYYALFIAAILFILTSITSICLRLGVQINAATGLFFLIVLLVICRILAARLHIPALSDAPLFAPFHYASPGIASSLGELMMTLIIICLITFYLFFSHRNRPTEIKRTEKLSVREFVMFSFSVLALALLFNLSGLIFKSLVLDSSISFALDNFFQLDLFSLAGLICMALLLVSLFFAGMILFLQSTAISRLLPLAIGGITGGLILYFVLNISLFEQSTDPMLYLWTAGFVLLYVWSVRTAGKSATFFRVIVWVSFFAAYSAVLLTNFNEQRTFEEERIYALRKAQDRDPVAEFLFNDITSRLEEDHFIKQFYSYPLRGRPIIERIQQLYFGGYFRQFDVQISLYNKTDKLLATSEDGPSDKRVLDHVLKIYGQSTLDSNLFFIDDGSGKHFYMARIPYNYEDGPGGTLYLLLTGQDKQSLGIYPELLLSDDLREPSDFQDMGFAVYINGQLTNHSGDYPYPLLDEFAIDQQAEYSRLAEGIYRHVIYRPDDSKKVVVTIRKDRLFRPLSLFSYFFLFYLLLLLISGAFYSAYHLLGSGQTIASIFDSSLRNRIQTAVISLIMLSFLLIGSVTVTYFSNQYNSYHSNRLGRKMRAVVIDLEYYFAEHKADDLHSPLPKDLDLALNSLSDIHAMDINLFNLDGSLLMSSQPAIFDKGLIAPEMQPLVYSNLSTGLQESQIDNERVGNLNYLAAYTTLKGRHGEPMMYVNLPYFAKARNLRTELSSFMVALINVYVFLFVGAGLLALLISNSITRSLTAIGVRFRDIQLGAANIPIEWKHQDEIGLLVEEYNKMLSELAKSAELLARSERESAWRQMARQVAHEIKNPLTPMRLSIQHLHRAFESGDPGAPQLARRITVTLLEQIENLARIAGEFSNFAQLPKPALEKLCLNDVVRNTVSLFDIHESIDIELDEGEEQVWVNLDKGQFIRVLNNLIKNAMQAIPEERKGLIRVEIHALSEKVDVRVSDNGKGMSIDSQQRVFEPNFTTKSSGMGLGLAMSKNIVESSGGIIWFESIENKGTIFHVELPRLPNE